MSLFKIREERKKLGAGIKRGPRTIILIILLVVVLVIIWYLGRFA